MSFDKAIADLIAALEANTAAHLGAAAPAKSKAAPAEDEPVAEKKKPGRPAKAAAPANKHTREEMQAVLTSLKEATDAATAKAIITEHGGVAKMAEIPEAKIDAVFAAATEALAEVGSDDGDEDGDM